MTASLSCARPVTRSMRSHTRSHGKDAFEPHRDRRGDLRGGAGGSPRRHTDQNKLAGMRSSSLVFKHEPPFAPALHRPCDTPLDGFTLPGAEGCPNAEVCLDPFHVVKLATEMLDQVRREVWNDARRANERQFANQLKGARVALEEPREPHRAPADQALRDPAHQPQAIPRQPAQRAAAPDLPPPRPRRSATCTPSATRTPREPSMRLPPSRSRSSRPSPRRGPPPASLLRRGPDHARLRRLSSGSPEGVSYGTYIAYVVVTIPQLSRTATRPR